MERIQSQELTELNIPTYIDETWINIFNHKYGQTDGQERFGVTLETEDWLVQTETDPSSAYFKLEDRQNLSHGWKRILNGRIWNAGITSTPQYANSINSPVLGLSLDRYQPSQRKRHSGTN